MINWKTISALMLCFSCSAGATESYEVFGGDITYHLLDFSGDTSAYRQKISPDGKLIYNPTYGVRYTNETDKDYWSATAFGGNNSLGYPMGGAAYTTGVKPNKYVQLGFVVGGYIQDGQPFYSLGIVPPSLGGIGTEILTPIIGAEINFKVKLTDSVFIKESNLISFITSSFVSVGVEF